MSTLFSYSPEDVTVLIAGILKVDGFTNGTFINISKDVVPFRTQRTADGEIARLYDNDSTYTVNITLHQASTSNDALTKLWELDAITQRGKFPLTIKDELGSAFFFAASCWVEGVPNMEYSTDIEDRVWTIRCSQGIINVGGNAEAGIVQDLINIAAASLPGLEGYF